MGTSSRPPANKHDDDIGNACATTGSTSTTRKITRSLPKEVAAPRLADGSASPPAGGRTAVLNPGLATEVMGHEDDGRLGADYYDDGEVIDWAPATLERPADLPNHIRIGSKHAVPTAAGVRTILATSPFLGLQKRTLQPTLFSSATKTRVVFGGR